MLSSFFKNIDLLGAKFHFYTNQNSSKRTILGGILTIFTILIFFLFCIIFGDNFFTRNKPSVTISTENNSQYEIFDLKKEKVLFSFRIEDYDGNYVNTSNILYFKIYYYSTEQDKNGKFRSIIHDEYLNYHVCNDSDYINRNLTENFGILYCPEFDGKKFGGYWDSPYLYYFEIQVYFCENGTQYSKNNSKCTSINELNDFLNQDHPKFFALYYPTIEFNPLSYNEPLMRFTKNYYYCLSPKLQRNDDIFLKKTIINDDKGWLLSNDKNFSAWGVDSIRSTYAFYSENDLRTDGSSSKIFEANLYTIRENNYYMRYYTKIQNVIAVVGSLINIIIFIFKGICSLIAENLWKYEIINNSFEIEENVKKNNFFIKKSNTEIIKISENHFIYNKKNQNNKIFVHQNEDLDMNKNSKNFKTSLFKLNTNDNINTNNSLKFDKIKNANANISHEQSGSYLLQKLNSYPLTTLKIFNKKFLNKEQKQSIFKNFNICFMYKIHKQYSGFLKWYYYYLLEINSYVRNIKEFDFLKKIILNEYQINCLMYLKKINLNNMDELKYLNELKNNINLENKVISYYNEILKNVNGSKIDNMLYDNLSEKIKCKIIYK